MVMEYIPLLTPIHCNLGHRERNYERILCQHKVLILSMLSHHLKFEIFFFMQWSLESRWVVKCRITIWEVLPIFKICTIFISVTFSTVFYHLLFGNHRVTKCLSSVASVMCSLEECWSFLTVNIYEEDAVLLTALYISRCLFFSSFGVYRYITT